MFMRSDFLVQPTWPRPWLGMERSVKVTFPFYFDGLEDFSHQVQRGCLKKLNMESCMLLQWDLSSFGLLWHQSSPLCNEKWSSYNRYWSPDSNLSLCDPLWCKFISSSSGFGFCLLSWWDTLVCSKVPNHSYTCQIVNKVILPHCPSLSCQVFT